MSDIDYSELSRRFVLEKQEAIFNGIMNGDNTVGAILGEGENRVVVTDESGVRSEMPADPYNGKTPEQALDVAKNSSSSVQSITTQNDSGEGVTISNATDDELGAEDRGTSDMKADVNASTSDSKDITKPFKFT